MSMTPFCRSSTNAAAQAEVREASGATPGIPPSSLMAFLRAKPSLAGAVLADFGTTFRNPFYQGRLDANISTKSVVSAAAVAARALHALAWDAPNLPPLTVRPRSSGSVCTSTSKPCYEQSCLLLLACLSVLLPCWIIAAYTPVGTPAD